MFIAAAAVLAPQATSAPAQAQPSANQSHAEALKLAKLMAPRDLMIEAEMSQFDQHFKRSILNGRTQEEADGDYPGLIDALVKAARPLVERYTERAVAEMQSSVAELIETRLQADEIAELTQFYESPTGQHVLRSMADSVDASAIYEQAVEQPDEPVTRTQVTAQIRAAATAAAEKYSDADQAALIEFMKRPVFAKLAGIQPALRQMMADLHNRTDPEFEAEVSEVLASAMSAHMVKVDTAVEE